MEQDIGRPLSHIAHNIMGYDLVKEAEDVLKNLTRREREVRNTKGKWYLLKVAPYYTLDRMIGGVVITLVDITELRNINERLLKLSAAVEQNPSLIAITDINGKIEYVNQKMVKMTDYPESQLLGQPLLELFSESPINFEEKWLSIKEGEEWNGELRYRKANGERFWVFASVLPICDKQGKVLSLLNVAEDISRRRAAEMALRESEERFDRLARATSEGIAIVEHDKILDVNQAFAKIFGYKQADLIGLSIGKLIQPALRNLVMEKVTTHYHQPYRSEGLRKDGGILPIEIQAKPMQYNKRLLELVAIRDLTNVVQEHLYRDLVHNMPNKVVAIFDHDLRYQLLEGRSWVCLKRPLSAKPCGIYFPLRFARCSKSRTKPHSRGKKQILRWPIKPLFTW